MRVAFVLVCLASFGVAYAAPIVGALSAPVVSGTPERLPGITLPAVSFPTLGVPNARPAPPLPRQAASPIPSRTRRPAVAPKTAAKRTGQSQRVSVPVTSRTYGQSSETSGARSGAAEADPFAGVPVVTNDTGVATPLPVAPDAPSGSTAGPVQTDNGDVTGATPDMPAAEAEDLVPVPSTDALVPAPSSDLGVDIERLSAIAAPTGAPVTESVTPALAGDALAEGIREWKALRPDADLSGVTVEIADLPDLELGRTVSRSITLDATAAGYGWSSVSGAAGHGEMDLLSVVRHELGHVLGYEHGPGLMEETMAVGEIRELPTTAPTVSASATDSVVAAPTSSAAGEATTAPAGTATSVSAPTPSIVGEATTAPAETAISISVSSSSRETQPPGSAPTSTPAASPESTPVNGVALETSSSSTGASAATSAQSASSSPELSATAAPPVGAPAATPVTAAQLDSALEQAKAEWTSENPTADLTGISAGLAELDGLRLAINSSGQITIDATAAGWGWTVSGGALDLRTAVLHEIGHVFGLEDAADDSLMGATLSAGETYTAAGAVAPSAASGASGPVAPTRTTLTAPAEWKIALGNGTDHVVTISLGDNGLGVTVDGVTETRSIGGDPRPCDLRW